MNRALWIVQGLLAALFLFGGTVKLMIPIEEMTAQMPLPGPFIQFIAIAEVLGGLGLILPWALRILASGTRSRSRAVARSMDSTRLWM